MKIKLNILFAGLFVSSVAYGWSPPPPTTFIPELGHGFLAVKGSYIKVEEELENGNRGDIEGYSLGTYLFHGKETDIAIGVGVEVAHAEGDQYVVTDGSDTAVKETAEIDTVSPTAYVVYTLFGGHRSSGAAISIGYSRIFYNIKGEDDYSINVWRYGLVGQFFVLPALSIVPFIEWAINGQTGMDLVVHFRGFDLSVGAVTSFLSNDDNDKETKYGLTLRKTW